MPPGLHKIPAEQYHADPCPEPSLSASIAHLILAKSGLHAWHAHPRLNPAHKARNAAILDAGSVAHSVLLEGSMGRVVIIQAKDFKTNAAKAERDQAWATGSIPVLAKNLPAINEMVEAAKKYVGESQLAGIFKGAKPEMTMLWQEGKTWCRARPDLLSEDNSVLLHYKTTAGSAEPNAFIRQMFTMGYDIAAGFYTRGAEALSIRAEPVFLVQENEPPYACSLVGLAPALADLAAKKADYALQLWKSCMASGKWSGYSGKIAYGEPPAYALAAFDERTTIDDMLERAMV